MSYFFSFYLIKYLSFHLKCQHDKTKTKNLYLIKQGRCFSCRVCFFPKLSFELPTANPRTIAVNICLFRSQKRTIVNIGAPDANDKRQPSASGMRTKFHTKYIFNTSHKIKVSTSRPIILVHNNHRNTKCSKVKFSSVFIFLSNTKIVPNISIANHARVHRSTRHAHLLPFFSLLSLVQLIHLWPSIDRLNFDDDWFKEPEIKCTRC